MGRTGGRWLRRTGMAGLLAAVAGTAVAQGTERGSGLGGLLAAVGLGVVAVVLAVAALVLARRAAMTLKATPEPTPVGAPASATPLPQAPEKPVASAEGVLEVVLWEPLEVWWRAYLEGYRQRLAAAPVDPTVDAQSRQAQQLVAGLRTGSGAEAVRQALGEVQQAAERNQAALTQLNLWLPLSQAVRGIEDNLRAFEQDTGALDASLAADEGLLQSADLFLSALKEKSFREWVATQPLTGPVPPKVTALLQDYLEMPGAALQRRAEDMERRLSVRGNASQMRDLLQGQMQEALRAALRVNESAARLQSQSRDPAMAALPSEVQQGIQGLSRSAEGLVERMGLRRIPVEEGLTFPETIAKHRPQHPGLSENWYGATGAPVPGPGRPGSIQKVMREGWYWSSPEGQGALVVEPCLVRLYGETAAAAPAPVAPPAVPPAPPTAEGPAPVQWVTMAPEPPPEPKEEPAPAAAPPPRELKPQPRAPEGGAEDGGIVLPRRR